MFIGAEIGMQQLEEKGEVDIIKIVSTLRQDRGGMVQTKDQYLFLYQVSFYLAGIFKNEFMYTKKNRC